MRSRTIAFCAGLTAAIGLAAPQAMAEGGKRVAFLDGPIADKYIGGMTRSFTETAKANGLDVSVVQSPFDPALQAQQLDDAIAKKVDAIVMMIMSQKALIPALTRAKAANIPVILINTPIPQEDLYTAFVGEDSKALGAMAGNAMADGLAKSGRTAAKVAVIAGSMDEGVAPPRAEAFKQAVESHPGFKVVAVEETHWAPPEAERAAGQLLARFSGQGGLDGIYGMNDPLANGAVQGALSAGVKVGSGKGELVVVGGNCLAPGIADIEQGTMYATVYWTPINMGRDTAEHRDKNTRRPNGPEEAVEADRDHHQGQPRQVQRRVHVLTERSLDGGAAHQRRAVFFLSQDYSCGETIRRARLRASRAGRRAGRTIPPSSAASRTGAARDRRRRRSRRGTARRR